MCAQFASERIRIDEVDEGALSVDLDDWQPLAILPFELFVAADIDLLELERRLGAYVLEDAASSLAEMTALCVVERDPDYG